MNEDKSDPQLQTKLLTACGIIGWSAFRKYARISFCAVSWKEE